jgi:Cu/Ag efflux protein CusF
MEEEPTMRKYLYAGLCLLILAPMAFAASDVVSAIKGTVKKIDAGSKTVIVETADGTEHVVHFVSRTVVYGIGETRKGAREALRSLKEGSEVVVHYTRRGAEEIAAEVDYVGKDGLKRAEGTISRIDRIGKRIIVKTAEGTEETYRLADHAAQDAGKAVVEGAEQSGKAIVYYVDEGGRKVAHFFEKAF